MDYLKKSLAPLTDDAWNEINENAKQVLKSYLSARKFVDIIGPKGWDFSAISLGRLHIPQKEGPEGLKYGIRKINPLIETRVQFEVDKWEMDNISRGCKDPDLDSLEEAAINSAKFEEDIIYHGFEEASVKGFNDTAELKMDLPEDPKEYLSVVPQSINMMVNASVEGPYALIVSPEQWKSLVSTRLTYPLEKHIEDILGVKIIVSRVIDNAYVASMRGGDFELTLGIDFSIGYDSYINEKIKLFLAETFTFNIYEPKAFVKIG
jgi:uncharacterized linocin/CFP29 family protein